MATKKEKTAIKSAVTREKKRGIVREEKHILWILLAIIFVLLYLLLAQSYGWWPYVQPKLGSAFYTNVAANAPADASKTTTSTGKSSTSTSKNTSSGSNTGSSGNGGSGTNSGGTSGGGSTTPTTGSGSIADLAANVNVGDAKTKISAKANNLGSGCAVVVNANTQTVLGKQEVCTYSQGDKIVTVTYLNNRVISASKSGF